MKPAVPGEVIDPCRCFEEDDRRTMSRRRVTSYKSRHTCNFEIIEPADKPALEALDEKFNELIHGRLIFDLYSAIIR